MTAEIGILNRVGVALAADSAVTIGQSADKIWTSADKLFQLSEKDPVAVMIYGNAEFTGVPWETIIKCFRRATGEVHRATVLEHADAFFAYLRNNLDLFPAPRQDGEVERLVGTWWFGFREHLKEVFDREAEARNGLDAQDVSAIADAEVRRALSQARRERGLKDFAVDAREEIRRRYGERLEKLKGELFGHLPLSRSAHRALISIGVLVLSRQVFGQAQSGVVFAGFGDAQYFPALIEYAVEGMAIGRPRYARLQEVIIDDGNQAVIVPFAQQEMVHSFMQGVDPRLSRFIRESTADVLSKAFSKLLDLVGALSPTSKGDVASLEEQINGLRDALFDGWSKRQEEYWDPVMTNVATLPKDELAAMAEAFVNLTKFRRRVTVERETVGGPIDVAVITKGDGFVWIRRKHYFDAKLNPRFMARFLPFSGRDE